jgi:hypothetical protein
MPAVVDGPAGVVSLVVGAAPQHHKVRSVRMAQAKSDPSDSDAHLLPLPSCIRSGIGGEAVVGLMCPVVEFVQHHKAPVTSIPHGGDHPADAARHFSGVVLTAPDEEPAAPAVPPEPLAAGRGACVEQPPPPSTTRHSTTTRAISNPTGESIRLPRAVPSDAFVIDSVSVIAVPAPRSGTDGDAEQAAERRPHPARRGHPHGAPVPKGSVTGQGARSARYRERNRSRSTRGRTGQSGRRPRRPRRKRATRLDRLPSGPRMMP